MSKSAPGSWTTTVGPLEPEIYEYWFVVDGLQGILDGQNPELKPGDFAASLLEIPGDPPRFDQLQDVPHEYHDLVQKNITDRGGVMTPMEDRILSSILRVIKQSGVRIEDVPAKHQDWAVNMRVRIQDIGWDGMYVPYRVGSHAVHGSWADVVMRHLVYHDDGFAIQWSLGSTDGRLLSSPAQLNLDATGYYVAKWFTGDDRNAATERLMPLIEDLEAVSHAAELAVQRV